jgi:hypothetical protein
VIPKELIPDLLLSRPQVTVDERRRHLLLGKTPNLGIHECLEGRDYQSETVTQNDRHLEAERLARPGWAYEEYRLTAKGREHYIKLTVTKARDSKQSQRSSKRFGDVSKLPVSIEPFG